MGEEKGTPYSWRTVVHVGDTWALVESGQSIGQIMQNISATASVDVPARADVYFVNSRNYVMAFTVPAGMTFTVYYRMLQRGSPSALSMFHVASVSNASQYLGDFYAKWTARVVSHSPAWIRMEDDERPDMFVSRAAESTDA